MPPSANATPRKSKKASGPQKDAIDPITGGEQNVAWLGRRQKWIDIICKYYGERLKPQSRALPIVPPANSDLLPGRLPPFDEKSFKERCASEGIKSSSSVTYGGNLLWIDPLCVSPSVPVMVARVKDLKDYWKKPESPDIVFDISVSWSLNSEKLMYSLRLCHLRSLWIKLRLASPPQSPRPPPGSGCGPPPGRGCGDCGGDAPYDLQILGMRSCGKLPSLQKTQTPRRKK